MFLGLSLIQVYFFLNELLQLEGLGMEMACCRSVVASPEGVVAVVWGGCGCPWRMECSVVCALIL